MRRELTIMAAAVALIAAPALFYAQAEDAQHHAEQAAALIIYDKPYEPAETACEAALDYEAEQVTEEEGTAVYAPSYGPVWYESDDAEAEADAKEWIALRESGGDYSSRNGQYVGRYQLNEMYLDGDYSEENQEAAAEAYIADRYGSWQAAQEHWREYGWY